MYRRNIETALRTALKANPVVFLAGARQTGKSTLAQMLCKRGVVEGYFNLDDLEALIAAKEDPVGFLKGLKASAVIDEVQRAPELFLPLKANVDHQREAGRFLLTGSANVMVLPNLAQALVGRMGVVRLWPFSQGELESQKEGFIDRAFSDEPFIISAEAGLEREDLLNRLARGGYPEAALRNDAKGGQEWLEAYIETLLQRDISELSRIEGLTQVPRLLRLLAARVGSLLNHADLGRNLGLANTTLRRYLALLEATFIVQLVPAWAGNLGKRLVKSPKVYLNDTGLALNLQGREASRLLEQENLLGPMVENFVVMELIKQIGWSRTKAALYHYRTQDGLEVDIILEDRQGRVVGIEVKSSETLRARDFNGLKSLAESLKGRFRRGILLYPGSQRIPFGARLETLPLETLWQP